MASSTSSGVADNTSDKKSPIYERFGFLYVIVRQTRPVSKAIWSLLAVPDPLEETQSTLNAEQKLVGLWLHLTGNSQSGFKVESEWGYSVPDDSGTERYTLHELCRLEPIAFTRMDLWQEQARRETDPGYRGDPSVLLEIVAKLLASERLFREDPNFAQVTQNWVTRLAPQCNGWFLTKVTREELSETVEMLPKE